MLTGHDIAEFTWLFNEEFFLETDEGNFIWSDPRYLGENTITPVDCSLQEYTENVNPGFPGAFGRDKGKHVISEYCGDDVKIISKQT